MEKVTAYVGLGSNLGDRAGNLLGAVRGLLDASLCVTRLSAIYETAPHGVVAQPSFLNMVAEVSVGNVTSEQMLARMLRVEYALGRTRHSPKAARAVDLDLLLFGGKVQRTPLLTLPHPELHRRRFVLVPLVELAPRLMHPTVKRTMRELLKNLDDANSVRRYQPNELNPVSTVF